MVRISVKNFGPIAEGSVDLKPLTIFIGPSNTGKSYMAGAVYVVMKAAQMRHNVSYAVRFSPQVDSEVSQEPSYVSFSDLPYEVGSKIKSEVRQAIEHVRETAANEMRGYWGPPLEFVRRGREFTDFGLDVHRDDPLFRLSICLGDLSKIPASFDLSSMSVESANLNVLTLDIEDYPSISAGAHEFNTSGVFNSLRMDALRLLFSGFPQNSYYLPAARSGIVQGQKVLAAALVGQSRRIGIEPMFFPALPGITTEFLSNLISLDRRMTNLTSDDALAKAIGFIEHAVLRGSVDLDESSGLPFPDIAYEQAGAGKFTLDRSSSMVSELAPLVLFLKYLVQSGDLLILEEPESHLHPAAQRQMARGIVRLVNAGVKVLITTHSDLFVAQVNNLMRISHASKRWLREKGFTPDECIDRENVGAYLFRRNEEQGGSLVEELEIRPDVGIDDAMFGEVVNEIYEETLLVERIRVP